MNDIQGVETLDQAGARRILREMGGGVKDAIDEAALEVWLEKTIKALGSRLSAGQGLAFYRNQDMSHHDMGMLRCFGYGAAGAQFEGEPPVQLPDMRTDYGTEVNWRYRLVAVFPNGELAYAQD